MRLCCVGHRGGDAISVCRVEATLSNSIGRLEATLGCLEVISFYLHHCLHIVAGWIGVISYKRVEPVL